MSKLSHLFAFVAGAAVGSVVTWKLIEQRYDELIQEEIDSVKEAFSNKDKKEIVSNTEDENKDKDDHGFTTKDTRKSNLIEYASKLQEEGYTDYAEMASEKKPEPTESNKKTYGREAPYVISPYEFGDLYGYDKISLTYYSDGILADDNDEIVDDVDEIVGVDSLKHFGEYEDDSVFVRNDQKKCDYEILLDRREYSEVSNSKPYMNRGSED